MSGRKTGVVFLLVFLWLQSSLAAEKWRVTSIYWPPFICKDCPGGGAGELLIKRILNQMKIEVSIELYPWSRALKVGKKSSHVGTYPMWADAFGSERKDLILSDSVYTSPVGFIFPANKAIKWDDLSDLKGYRVGHVQDYGNTVEFNRMIKNGDFKSNVSISEVTNIRKVAAQRVDLAIVDLNVARYLLNHELKDIAEKVELKPQVLEVKTLHFGFNKTHKDKVEAFNRALKSVDSQKILRIYFEKYFKTKLIEGETS